jgi:hypothetical protein
MSRKVQLLAGGLAVGMAGLAVAWVAVRRIEAARDFSQRRTTQTAAGTKYSVQLLETTVGRVETGYVVIVYARFENPNAAELVLPRERFELVTGGERFYRATASGTQPALIKLPAHGVVQKEALSFAVGDDALAGPLALEIGHLSFVVIKNERPWTKPLPPGQFMTFRSSNW